MLSAQILLRDCHPLVYQVPCGDMHNKHRSACVSIESRQVDDLWIAKEPKYLKAVREDSDQTSGCSD